MVGKGFCEALHFRQNLCQFALFSLGEGVGGVAVGTAQVAGGKPEEHARQAGKSAFALQAQIDFVDNEGVGHARSLARRAEN